MPRFDHALYIPWRKHEELHGGPISSIMHLYRQANQMADCLARLGSQQVEVLVVTSRVPLAAREFVLVDAFGVGHLRN